MRTSVVLILGLLVVGCGGSNANSTPRLVRRRVTHLENATAQEDRSRCDATQPGRAASEYDTNGDGVPDVRKVYQTIGEGIAVRSVLVCREVDLNHDGTKDMFRFYNEEGRTIREEEDRDFDSRIDVITYFENGEVVRREYDTNGDGQVDMRVIYRDRRPWRAEREVGGDRSPEFRPDYWEYYDQQGHVIRIGWDYNGDGRADRWDRVDRITPARDEAPATPPAPQANASAPAAPATP
jgi:hypothetical protein